MSFSSPGHRILRRSISGHEGEWVKSFDPPAASPPTPEYLNPTNPVPAFIARTVKDAKMKINNTVSLDLMRTQDIKMWNGKELEFFLIACSDVKEADKGTFPALTIRIPRGVVFHAFVEGGGQTPHTIHWHGIEPSSMNDGVGHTSMEIGEYRYQWQPNHIGSYFYHCHRNTAQHFEFGLYGFLIVEPPDAFVGPNAGGYPRRTAANLSEFPEFPGFNSSDIELGDPHAMTVPYDVEALWVIDDIDSAWREQAHHAHQAFAKHGTQPGVNDEFRTNDRGSENFFAFHDYNPDYFVVTGKDFPGVIGSTVGISKALTIPRALNSGVEGMQISINAKVNQTILVRLLCAAYSRIKVTFPVDVIVIAADGRALGVPPYGKYNHAYKVSAGTPIEMTTAQRIDVLFKPTSPLDTYAQIEFRHLLSNSFLLNGRIPIEIK
ncbi:multicopper oxidase domain-containing protein [Bacillus sp. JJ1562]|uniref:multicopper oxidase domain-containing protein n=1 Tax=Bacillus sp. JJ1562 TaxID=3122960 RepID=UPI003002FD37